MTFIVMIADKREEGHTPEEIQQEIEKALRGYFPDWFAITVR